MTKEMMQKAIREALDILSELPCRYGKIFDAAAVKLVEVHNALQSKPEPMFPVLGDCGSACTEKCEVVTGESHVSN